ncbi:hypothetical protein KKD52_07810 [Myxococcota bacterium]|jgi:hypothetical protein|nr:hypothetical protein [Myxococcota bacterium]MBU1412286.1 hypothetical protein [Myxococcota bacterium]MBU1510254.1 hypothetical protein [Myxococcota bacterium]PKN27683.1 MAG: hypothetical protein CVU65_01750 [Deltaproteobacteria bacterium HGW-Deltaproteobacteria-22]
MSNLFFLVLVFTTPPTPEPMPTVALINLDHPGAGEFARVQTMLALQPAVRLLSETEFTPEQQASLKSTLQAVAAYPDPLVRAVLEKHRVHLKIDRWVILTARGLYVQGPGEAFSGPFAVPGPKGRLSEAFLLLLQKPQPPARRSSTGAQAPFYRNWLFWTGVGVIVGGLTVMSLLAQEPTDVDVHVFRR